MKYLQILLLTSLLSAPAFGQTSATITVNVSNISTEEGRILISLFNSEESFLGKPYKALSAMPDKNGVTFDFTGITAGEYTISVIHDLNSNGTLDTNFMGIPSEPYGISMEGKNRFAPPSYSDALFTVNQKELNLSIEL